MAGHCLAERGYAPSAAPGSDVDAGPRGEPDAVGDRARSPAASSIDTVAVAKRALPGTVMIQVGPSTGSGFVLDDQGRIMTNNHVVADAADGADHPGESSPTAAGRRPRLVGRSPSYDLAVIKVKPASHYAPADAELGNSDADPGGRAGAGDRLAARAAGTVTQGIVSAQNRPVVVRSAADADAPVAYIDGIQTDAPINPGNSGGPLVDARRAGDRGQLRHLDPGQRPSSSRATSVSASPSRSTRR